MINDAWKAVARRRGRGSIPPPNPNPLAPNEPRVNNKGQDNQSQKNNGNNQGGQGNNNQGGNQGGGGGHQNRHGNQHGGGGGNGGGSSTQPNQSGAATGGTPYAPPTDPRDATYWANRASLLHQRNFGLREQDIEGAYSNSQYQADLGSLRHDQPIESRQYQNDANKGGAFYSSATTEGLGQIARKYVDAEGNLARGHNRDESLRSMMRDMINEGFTMDDAMAYAESVDRTSQNEINRPALGKAVDLHLGKDKKKKKKNNQGGGGGNQGGGGGHHGGGGGGNSGGGGKGKGKGKH